MSAEYDELAILEYSGQLQSEISAAVRSFGQKWEASLFDSILETHVLSELQLRDALARALQLQTCDEISLPPNWRPFEEIISYKHARSNFWLVGTDSSAGTNAEPTLFLANPITLPEVKKLLIDQFPTISILVVERSEVVRAIDLYYPLSRQLQPFS